MSKPLPPREDEDTSAKVRAYLAKVYRLAENTNDPNGFVGTSALADRLYVTAPAVNRMVNRLKEMGLLAHEPYKGIKLTPQGRIEALKELRVHRLIEAFLVRVMGIDWSVAHHEADLLCEGVSELILERMERMAEFPRYCPHGEPIPTVDGQVEAMNDVLLAHVAPATRVQITRLKTREPERLKYIEALGLLPNTPLEVLHVAPFNGPMQLKIQQEYRIVGHNLAELIRVKPL